MVKFFKQILLYVLIFSIILLIANSLKEESRKQTDILSYSKFINSVKENKVISIKIKKDAITGIYTKNDVKRKFKTYYYPADMELIPILRKHNVDITVIPPQETPWWMWVLQIVPYVFIIFIFMLMMRNSVAGNSQAFSFGKSRAKLWNNKFDKVTFKNVAGVDEAVEELEEIVKFLKYPQKFEKIGARIPKGVLLVGPPGSGKTLLGRAVAGEANVPFYYISGSDFVEMFVGVGAARVRDLFNQAKRSAPSVVFIDEIDAVGRQRGAGYGGGHDEREQTLNQLLVEMDGFEPNSGVIILAATNRPDVLDPALLRPGRFDRRVVVDKPDIKGRLAILKIHAKNKKLSQDIDLEEIAKRTPGFTGADLENLLNEAALIAAKDDKDKIHIEDVEEAIDKVIMGPARKSRVLTDKVKEQTAYHEAGHALIASLIKEADPVKKVTILPRGMALGLTWTMPEEDKLSITKQQLIAEIKVLLGGRAAEEIKYDIQTTGASNDLKRATDIIRNIITKYGMDDEIGPINISNGDEVFLGRDLWQKKSYSEDLASLIDLQIRSYMKKYYNEVKNMLKENINYLEEIAQSLVKLEIITKEDIDFILNGGKASELIEKKNLNKNQDKKEKTNDDKDNGDINE